MGEAFQPAQAGAEAARIMQPSVSTTRLKIEFAQATDPGRDPNKQVNEDSCGYAESKFGYVCVLCDGMGGHYGGKEASRTAITTIFEMIEQTPIGMAPVLALRQAIEEAARRVYRLGGPPENRTRPGSTVVAMLLHDRGVDVAHVGDSRAYVIRANQIYPLTRDHSMVQGMIDAGMLTEESAIGHPDANKITRALGMKPEVEVEVRPEPMELFAGDVLLQSSDGLTDLAVSADILGATRQALASGSVQHACDMLVQMANDRGGHDNITVQMVRVIEAAPKARTTIPEAPAGQAPVVVPAQAAHPQAAHAQAQPAWAGAPSETVAMTAPGTPAAPAASMRNPPAASYQQVQPTVDGRGAAAMPSPYTGPAPTVLEAPPPASQNWNSGMYTGPTPPAVAQGQQALAPYRMDQNDAALQLPPQSARPYQLGSGGMMPMTPMPPSVSTMNGRPPRGGIVFIIIGLSAVIAVLILIVLWAILSR